MIDGGDKWISMLVWRRPAPVDTKADSSWRAEEVILVGTARSAVEGDRSRIYPHQLHNKENLNTNNVSTAAAVATRLTAMVGLLDFGMITTNKRWDIVAGGEGGRAGRDRRQDQARCRYKLVPIHDYGLSRVG